LSWVSWRTLNPAYDLINADDRGYYSPLGQYAQTYSKISSIDDFADSYAVVVLSLSNIPSPYTIGPERSSLIQAIINSH